MPKMLERYLVFAGDTYYPAGGWGDYHSSHETMLEAQEVAKQANCDWWHVVDTETNRVVSQPAPEYTKKVYGGIDRSRESVWRTKTASDWEA